MEQTTFYPGYSAWARANPRADAILRAPAPFDMGYQGTRGVAAARVAAAEASTSAGLGRLLKQGVRESFVLPRSTISGGEFIYRGWRKGIEEVRPPGSRMFGHLKEMSANEINQVAKQQGVKFTALAQNRGGARGAASAAGRFAKTGLRTAGRYLPLLGTAYFAYEGYKSGGVMGALGGVAESVAWTTGLLALETAVGGSAVLAPFALGAAAIGGYTMFGRYGYDKLKSYRQTEMGGGDQVVAALSSAGAATMRQRSLMALNNTHLNGRMALGNEGFLMHRSFGI